MWPHPDRAGIASSHVTAKNRRRLTRVQRRADYRAIVAFAQALPEAAVYVVNDNSRDRTRELAFEALSKLRDAGAVIDEARQGKGNALRRTFRDIEADVYLVTDADMTYPADRARELISPILEKRADMVVGDRHSRWHYARENRRSFHQIGNRLVQTLVNSLFGPSLRDIMSGSRAFSRTFVKSYPIIMGERAQNRRATPIPMWL